MEESNEILENKNQSEDIDNKPDENINEDTNENY